MRKSVIAVLTAAFVLSGAGIALGNDYTQKKEPEQTTQFYKLSPSKAPSAADTNPNDPNMVGPGGINDPRNQGARMNRPGNPNIGELPANPPPAITQ